MLFEVEGLCFSKWKSCAFRSEKVVLFEEEGLRFSKWKSCALGSKEELIFWKLRLIWKRESVRK